jgi:A1 cistron-splicing factor AAR2
MTSTEPPASQSQAHAHLTPEQAQKLFERNAFLIINDLPRGSQLCVDGIETYLTDSRFQGFKLVPKGWHLFAWSAAPSERGQSGAAEFQAEGLRCAVFRYFEEQQVVVRTYDVQSDRLLHPDAKKASVHNGATARHRLQNGPSLSESTIVSRDHLRSLDPQLAPYPLHKLASFVQATENLQCVPREQVEELLAALIGIDTQSGDLCTDALAEAEYVAADGSVASSASSAGSRAKADRVERAEKELDQLIAKGREVKFYGKGQQPSEEASSEAQPAMQTAEALAAPKIRTPALDVRRSWPPGSTGSELTRWSVDKSWLLQDLARRCRDLYGDANRLAAEEGEEEGYRQLHILFELSFLLWMFVQNSALLSYWDDIIKLFCNAPALCGAPGEFEQHPAFQHLSTPTPSAAQNPVESESKIHASPKAIAKFMLTLKAQLELLPDDFFSAPEHRIEGMQDALVGNLGKLRSHVARSLAASAAAGSSASVTAQRNNDKEGEQEEEELENAYGESAGSGSQSQVKSPARAGAKLPSSRKRRAPLSAPSTSSEASRPKLKTSNVPPDSHAASGAEAGAAIASLLPAWRTLSHLMQTRFGIELDAQLDEEIEARQLLPDLASGGGASTGAEGEVGMEYEEEGEDAPVVVEL